MQCIAFNPCDQTGLLQFSDVALFLSFTQSKPFCQTFLSRVRFAGILPPEITVLHEDGELSQVQADSLLCPEEQGRKNIKTNVQNILVLFFSEALPELGGRSRTTFLLVISPGMRYSIPFSDCRLKYCS